MCASSVIYDYARDTLPGRFPIMFPPINPLGPAQPFIVDVSPDSVPRHEFEALKREVEELKILLAAAKRYDEKTGQPECEQAQKIEFLKKLAEFVGVDLKDI